MPEQARGDAPSIRIQVCGPLVVDRAGRRVDDRLPGRQGRLLCGYLVLNRHRYVPRGELIDAIWPARPPGNVDSGLSALLSKIRQVLGTSSVDGRATLRLRLVDPWVDLEVAREAVHRAESSVAAGDWVRAWAPSQVALFAAERGLLAGEEGEETFDWLVDERRRLAETRLRALEAYGSSCLGIGGSELAAACRAGRSLVEVEPFRESGYRLLMRALAAQGNLAEALLVYDRLRRTLREELGVSPSPVTQTLFAELNS
ncbi:MAG TPA: BTAD domain-containing putative transcriptional regulator [Actinomycetes bacterium]|nr:BTAD domain-containing putative transcriptional regulator [Actinomycetes bacterium]